MNHREYLKLIIETPVAYNDETSQLIGKVEKNSNTVWGKAPPIKATVSEVLDWVEWAKKQKIIGDEIKHFVGRGASRMCLMNDGKTVFKYNYNKNGNVGSLGNQTKYEIKFFAKWGHKYGDILTQVYKAGENWSISERIDQFEIGKFEDLTGVVWGEFYKAIGNKFNAEVKRDFRKYKSFEKMFEAWKVSGGWCNGYQSKYSNENILDQILKCHNLMRFLECAVETNLSLIDLHTANLGFRRNQIVILDYGFDEKR